MKNKMAASRQTNLSAQVKEIRKEYCDTLDSLTFNSKPIIDTLSEIAKDYARSIPQIGPPTVVKVIEDRIMREKNPRVKLPTLYLMDSIIKNHGEAYKSLFMKNLVETFAAVFRVSKEDERAKMYKLRQTWTPNMPSEILYNLDVKIKEIDPAWPILAKPVSSNNIHINPKRLQSLASTDESGDNDSGETEIDRQIRELKRKKQQLELERMRQEVAQLEDSLHPFDTGASDPKVERPSTSSKKSTTTSVQEKKSENKDPRKNKKTIYVNESKKDQLPENLVKMLDIKPEPKIEILENRNSVKLVVPETDAKNRSKSRSPARRQSPTSTSSEVSSAVSVPPPPPPNIRKANEYEDIKKSRKNQKSRETSSSSEQQLPGSSSSNKKSRESKKRSPSPEKQKNFKIPKKQKTRETSSPNKHHEQKRPSPFKDVQDHRPSQNNRRGSQEPDNGPRDAGGHPIRPTSGPQRPLNEADHPDDIIRDEDMDTGNRHSGRNFRGNNRGGPRSNMDPRNQRQGPGPWQGNRGPPLDPLGPNAPRSIADLQPPGPDGPGPRNFHPRFREQHPIRPSPWMNGPPNGPGPGGPGGPGHGGPQFPHPMGPGPNDGPWNNGPPPGGPHGRFDGPPPRGGGGHFNPNMNQFNGPDPWIHNGPPPPRHPLRPDFIPPQGPPGGPPWMNHENFREISPFHNSNSNSNEPMPNHFDNPESNQENQNLNPNVISMDDDPRFQKVMDNNSQSEFMKQETEQQPEPEIAKPEVSKVLDVHQLLQNLVNKGMVSAGTKGTIPGLEVPANPEPVKEEPKEPEVDSVPEITKTEKSASPEKVTLNWEASMKKTKAITPVILVSHDLSIKTRQQGIVEQIFDPDAMQCTNCGVRYSPNEAIAYQKHKDWHFRMNKHKQVLHKRAQSRRWYLGQSDWIISHEIEDNVADLLDEANENENADELIPTVPKDDNPANNRCPVCKEDFIEFYKDENPDDEDDDGGRYHLQNAVRPQGPGTKAYHPQCLVDANKHGVDESFERFESMEEDPNDEYVIGEVATNRLIVTPTDETKIKEETPDADQDVEMKEEEVNATETTAAIPETDVEVKAEIDDSASLATSNVEDQGTTEAVIKKEVPESEVDVEVKNEPETDVEVKNEDIDMQDLKEVEDEEKDFPSSNTSLMNLTADAGVTTAFSYPVASDIKINITSQSSAPGSPNPNDDQNQPKVEEPEVKEPETEFDPDAIIQEACNEDIEEPFRHKPKLRGRKLTELPATDKGKDFSSLCSIM